MNIESLWEQTCALLSRDMPYVSYNTWVEGNMVPGILEDDTMFITVKMDRMITMIQSKYADLIEKRLSEAAGRPMKIVLLSKEEMAERTSTDSHTEPQDDNDPHLNPKYTFESFVVGNANRFAQAAALAVAESPGEAYNPLFIYGGVGLGKTHLMQAIGHFIHQADPKKKILYMTSENFTNELISAIQQKKTFEFREKTVQEHIEVPDDVLQLIASKIDSNIRELEGCLTKLVAYSSLTREPITIDPCEQALKDVFSNTKIRKITAELIMQTVADYYGLTVIDLTGPTRKREITVPRQIAMYLTREMTGISLPQIGTVFGGRDHTTVLHSCKSVEATMKENSDVKAVVDDIKHLVKNAQ